MVEHYRQRINRHQNKLDQIAHRQSRQRSRGTNYTIKGKQTRPFGQRCAERGRFLGGHLDWFSFFFFSHFQPINQWTPQTNQQTNRSCGPTNSINGWTDPLI